MATAPLTRPSPVALMLAGALSLAVAMGIGRFAFTPMLPLMIRAGQLDMATGGWMAAANYAGYFAGALTAVRLPLGPARLAIVALLLTVLLTVAMAVPGPTALWLVLRFAAGVCSAWTFVATSVWCLGALAQSQRPGLGTAIYAGVGGGIALAGLACLAGSAVGTPVPVLWLALGALALVLTLPVAAVLRRLDPQTPAASNLRPVTGGTQPAGTRGLVVCYGLLGFGYILPATFLPVLARSVIDDPRWFGLAWPVFGAMAGASTLLAAWRLQRVARLHLWAVSQALMGIGVLLPSLWQTGWTIALSALLVGGTFMIITLAGVQEMRARATGDPTALIGRLTAAFALGQIAGPLVSAVLVQLPGAGASGLNIALQAAAAGLLLSAPWLWRAAAHSTSRKELSHAPS